MVKSRGFCGDAGIVYECMKLTVLHGYWVIGHWLGLGFEKGDACMGSCAL